ncbi:MAG: hypothetical protein JWR02_2139 [Mucilaginibacter sp.]|nr:hypothetical protein [Mucilaginibacter sp.]
MTHHFVFDTVGFINFHFEFFNEKSKLSKRVIADIEKCLSSDYINYKLIIPSIVIVEIFEKQLNSEEKASRFKYEIMSQYFDSEDVEIKGLEKEVLEIYKNINDEIIQLETHDKIILASAIQMEGKLITNDTKIATYVNATEVVELVF